MLTVPRLSSRIRVALYGDPNGVADIEALELQRNSIEVHQTKKQTSSGEFTWRNCSHRFRAKQSKAQDAKLAFDNFTASVATHASHDGATNMLVNVAGDVYGALLADGTADKGVARANLEATFGSVKDRDWRTVRPRNLLDTFTHASGPRSVRSARASRYYEERVSQP